MNELLTEHKLLISLILILVMLAARWLAIRQLKKHRFDESKEVNRWINSIKNTVNFLIVVGLVIIWLSELRFVALSIATFIVALVIATREFIQCFTGSLYQASARTYSVGDWVQIGPNSGEVIRSDWLSTVLLEVDLETMSYGYTGKTLVIPNSFLLTNTVKNLNFMRRYVAHSFTLTRDCEVVNLITAKDFIFEKAKSYCQPFEDVARRYNSHIEKRLGATISGPKPDIRFSTTVFGKNSITITIFCPTDEAIAIEQKLTEDLMNFWYSALKEAKLNND